jgi:hypothetical protein
VAANTCLASVTGFVGPLIGAVLADAIGINATLFIIAGARLLTGLGFRFLHVGAPGPAQPPAKR